MGRKIFQRRTAAVALVAAALTATGLATASAATADTSTKGGWPLLQEGSSGNNVKSLQYLLRCAGTDPRPEADGAFGNNTERAVKAFQTTAGIDDDGKVGSITWYKLTTKQVFDSEVGVGDEGDCVYGAQVQLIRHGHKVPFDGGYDGVDKGATADFQKGVGLEPTGVVNAATWHELITGG